MTPSKQPRVLVVDDEPAICWALERLGESAGLDVHTAASAEQGLEAARQHPPDVLLLDVRLPGIDGLSAVTQFRQLAPQVPIVIMTAHGDLETAVRAVKEEVFEYIVKPFDLEQIRGVIDQAVRVGRRSESFEPSPTAEPISGFVGQTPAMQEVFKSVALAACSQASVLITGESGTGKELAARAIHRHSNRRDGPFVAVNIASLPPTLAESELFGHVRGAFTGAETDREGLLVRAHGGTLFLDEVADIPMSVQVKLLRVLEEGAVVPVGGRKAQPTDFRIVSATHQDLWSSVEARKFRHDLYFRLTAYRIHLPPLRERVDDIPLLAEFFLRQLGRRGEKLPPATVSALQERQWYGNVRELRNALEHATIVARQGPIQPWHLPEAIDRPLEFSDSERDPTAALRQSVEAWTRHALADASAQGRLHEMLVKLVEQPLFRIVLEQEGGNVRAAAERLGIHRTTLSRKLGGSERDGGSLAPRR